MDLNTLVPLVTGAVLTLLSIVVTSILAARNDKLKWDREHQARFDKDRLELYAKFSATADELYHKLQRTWDTEPSSEEIHEVLELFNAWSLTFARVRMVATNTVVLPAHEVFNTLANGIFWPRSLSMEELTLEYLKAHAEFINAIRKELGVITDLKKTPVKKG